MEDGWLNLDKQYGISCCHALNMAKAKLSIKKAGYVATLEPIATGVLAIALQDATKLISRCDDNDEIY